jgi:hypothetical protein
MCYIFTRHAGNFLLFILGITPGPREHVEESEPWVPCKSNGLFLSLFVKPGVGAEQTTAISRWNC